MTSTAQVARGVVTDPPLSAGVARVVSREAGMADGRNEVRCDWCMHVMRRRPDAGPARRWCCEACGAEAMQWRPFVLAGTPEAPIPTVQADAGGRA